MKKRLILSLIPKQALAGESKMALAAGLWYGRWWRFKSSFGLFFFFFFSCKILKSFSDLRRPTQKIPGLCLFVGPNSFGVRA